VAAVVLGSATWSVALLVLAVALPAWAAGVLRPVLRATFVLALPLALSAALINLFLYPDGATVLVRLGPLTITAEGAGFAAGVVLRVLVIAGAATLFSRTTRIPDLVMDLERRGVSRRIAFVVGSAVGTIPGIVERAAMITAAQRARGLDTEGSIRRRIRGVVPIVGPTILGAINEAEERAIALEARGFTRPGRRTLLWEPLDTSRQRVARWLLVLAIPVTAVTPALGLRLP